MYVWLVIRVGLTHFFIGIVFAIDIWNMQLVGISRGSFDDNEFDCGRRGIGAKLSSPQADIASGLQACTHPPQ